MKNALVILALVALAVAQDPCYLTVTSGSGCHGELRCAKGTFFWSYPLDKCTFRAVSQARKAKHLSIFIQSLHTDDYSVRVLDESNVRKFNPNHKSRVVFSQRAGGIVNKTVAINGPRVRLEVTGPSQIQIFGAFYKFEFLEN